MGGALPKYREPAKCQRLWAKRLASLMCVSAHVGGCLHALWGVLGCVYKNTYARCCECEYELVCKLYTCKPERQRITQQ